MGENNQKDIHICATHLQDNIVEFTELNDVKIQ